MTKVTVKHISKEKSRVSDNFTANEPYATVACFLMGVSPDHLANIRFAIMEQRLLDSDCVFDHCTQGTEITMSRLQNKNLYIGRLKYQIPGGNKLEHAKVFEHIGVQRFEVSFLPTIISTRIGASEDKKQEVNVPFPLNIAVDTTLQVSIPKDFGLRPVYRKNIKFDFVSVNPPKVQESGCGDQSSVSLSGSLGKGNYAFSNLRLELVEKDFLMSPSGTGVTAVAYFDQMSIRVNHIKDEASRVSQDFNFPTNFPSGAKTFQFRVSTPGISPLHLEGLSFAIMQKPRSLLDKSTCVVDGCKVGQDLQVGDVQGRNGLYIGRLKLEIPGGEEGSILKLSKESLFDALKQKSIELALTVSQPIGVLSLHTAPQGPTKLFGSVLQCPPSANGACNITLVSPNALTEPSFAVLEVTSEGDNNIKNNSKVIKEGKGTIQLQASEVAGKRLCVGRLKMSVQGPQVLDAAQVDHIPLSVQVQIQ